MKDTLFLLIDQNDGQPWEMLCFKGDVDKTQIQNHINRLYAEYLDLEEKNDESLLNYEYSYEYILDKLNDVYDYIKLSWSNDDRLYF